MHSSKLWPETEVVNYDKMKKYKFDPKNCTKDIFKQYDDCRKQNLKN
jgi:hypothetical protein